MIEALWRSRAMRWLLAANGVAAVVSAFVPLADHLGFEFAFILTFVNAIAAPALGFAAAGLDKAASADHRRPARAATTAGLLAVAALLLPAGIMLLNAFRRPACDPAEGFVWLLLLPAPTTWLAATLGTLVRHRIESRRRAIGAMIAVEVVSLGANLATVYVGPAIYVFDHFFGYYPGPLYDETVLITPALLAFRGATILWGAAAAATAGALGSGDPIGRRMHRVWSVGLIATLLLISVFAGSQIGWRTTDRSLSNSLGGTMRVDRVVLHYPRDWSDRAVEELRRDAAYTASEVERAFDLKPSRPVHVWMYRSPEEKRRLVGAEGTAFAKPWRHEVHINPAGFPHSSLRHEFIHAFAAEFAGGPFRVPGAIIPNSALIEGLAEAYDIDDGAQTIVQRAKAMRDLGLAPNLSRIFSTFDFYREAPSRAYVYAGAFMRFLHQRSGGKAVRALYQSGNLAAIGDPVALMADFERMVDTVKTDEDARANANRRFATPSLFERRCAREVSKIADYAELLAADRQWEQALSEMTTACALQPENPAVFDHRLSLAIRSRRLDAPRIRAIAESLWNHPRIDPILAAGSRISVGDDLWRRGDTTGARALYDIAATLQGGAALHRSIVARRRALSDSTLARLLRPLFTDGVLTTANMLDLNDALQRRPADAILGYLLGRQLIQRGAHDRGGDQLERALSTGLNDAELTKEALRLLVQARAMRHRCDDGSRARESLRAADGSAADDATAADWVARCRFEVARGWVPLP